MKIVDTESLDVDVSSFARIDAALAEPLSAGFIEQMTTTPNPPAPPPMRVGDGVPPASELGVYLLIIVVAIAFGVICGLKMAGRV